MKPVEILLVGPGNHDGSYLYKGVFMESLALGFLAGALREKGFDVEILDRHIEDVAIDQFAPMVARRAEGKLVGFTGMIGRHLLDMEYILRYLRDSHIHPLHVAAGGIIPSLSPSTVLADYPLVDSVLCYEGEWSIVELARRLSENESLENLPGRAYRKGDGTIVFNGPSPYFSDLDQLPFAARDNLATVIERNGPVLMQSSRGCHGQCTFCIQHDLNRRLTGGGWRGRSPQNIVREITGLLQQFPVQRLKFVDENFFCQGEEGQRRAFEFAEILARENITIPFLLSARVDDVQEATLVELMKVGLYRVHIGIEAGTDRILDRYNKKTTLETNMKVLRMLKKLGLELQIGFIMFDPETTLEEMQAALCFLREEVLGLYIPFGGIAYRLRNSIRMYPGAPLYEHYAKKATLKRARKDPYLFLNPFKDPRVHLLWSVFTRNLEPVQDAFRKLEVLLFHYNMDPHLLQDSFVRIDEKSLDWSLRIVNYVKKYNMTRKIDMKDFLESLDSDISRFCSDLVASAIRTVEAQKNESTSG